MMHKVVVWVVLVVLLLLVIFVVVKPLDSILLDVISANPLLYFWGSEVMSVASILLAIYVGIQRYFVQMALFILLALSYAILPFWYVFHVLSGMQAVHC